MSKFDEANAGQSPPPPYQPSHMEPSQSPPYPQQGGYPQQAPYPQQGGYPVTNQEFQQNAPPQGQPYPGFAQPMYPQPGYPGQNINVTVYNNRMGPIPTNIVCPNCRAQVITGLEYSSGVLTFLLCAGLFLVGCWAGCCLIPFCINGCKDAYHFCPNCQHKIGEYRRI